MNNVPQKIYLQIGDECDADDFNELSTEDITWAADNIFKNDFEYVLASDKDKEIERLKGLIEKAHSEGYSNSSLKIGSKESLINFKTYYNL